MPKTVKAGQYQPLTTCLKNVLKDYPSDITPFKEFAQNADDAGARNLHFVIDLRQNSEGEVVPEWSLMKLWLGPAFWVYNDASFKDEDFDGIRRLGQGGKPIGSGKIGRFGLGFCSCYNFTDVPQVVSGTQFLILDPHLKFIGGDHGLRMDLTDPDNQAEVTMYPGLFAPYRTLEVEGVPPLDPNALPYSNGRGTLFRLPFRTKDSVREASEISNLILGQPDISKLKDQFAAEAHLWLLFMDGLQEIRMSLVSEGGASSSLVVVNRSSTTPSRLPPAFLSELSIEKFDGVSGNSLFRYVKVSNSAVALNSVAVAMLLDEAEHCGPSDFELGRTFVFLPLPFGGPSLAFHPPVHYHVHAPFNLSQDRRSLLFSSGVDKEEQDKVETNRVCSFALASLLLALLDYFCRNLSQPSDNLRARLLGLFPPLLDASNQTLSALVSDTFWDKIGQEQDMRILPTISGEFTSLAEAALLGNSTLDDASLGWLTRHSVPIVQAPMAIEALAAKRAEYSLLSPEWLCNYLRSDSVARQALERTIPSAEDDEGFVAVLAVLHFVLSQPSAICHRLYGLPLLPCADRMHIFANDADPVFVVSGPQLLVMTAASGLLGRFVHLRALQSGERLFRELASSNSPYQVRLWASSAELVKRALEVIHMAASSGHDIDKIACLSLAVLQHWSVLGLDGDSLLLGQLQSTRCVCDCRGGIKSPKELLDPSQQGVADLFPQGDGPFPSADFRVRSFAYLLKFRQDLSEEEVGNVVSSFDSGSAQTAVALLAYLTEAFERGAFGCSSGIEFTDKPWLPALPRPAKWPDAAPWAGESGKLYRPCDLHISKPTMAIGLVRPLVGCSEKLCAWFVQLGAQKLSENYPFGNNAQVVETLKHLEGLVGTCQLPHDWAHSQVCHPDIGLYRYLPVEAITLQAATKQQLDKLWLGEGFVPFQDVAHESEGLEPQLFKLPRGYHGFPLFTAIKSTFDASDLIRVLKRLTTNSYDTEALNIVLAIIRKLGVIAGERKLSDSEFDELLLPTKDQRLCSAATCVYNNMPWLEEDRSIALDASLHLLHPKVANEDARLLHVRPLSEILRNRAEEEMPSLEVASASSSIEAAGQVERLTTRLQNILRGYDGDATILKEFVQNADDAGATEVHFVFDWRQWRCESLLDDSLARWQGACLWVFNDATFKADDFNNICALGRGGKRGQQKIGMFGVGFCSAYHLTDLPSVLSADKLQLLDPHVCHTKARGASDLKPGLRINMLKDDIVGQFPDQFFPYQRLLAEMQCNEDAKLTAPVGKTLFRLPFRTAETLKYADEISTNSLNRESVQGILASIREEAHQWLLFLSSVKRIRVSSVDRDQGGMPSTERHLELDVIRNDVATLLPDQIGLLEIKRAQRPSFHYATWGQDGERASKISVALPIKLVTEDTKENSNFVVDAEREAARIFVWLPTRLCWTGLMHVHLPVILTPDRNNMQWVEGGEQECVVQLNWALVQRALPKAILAFLGALVGRLAVADYMLLFPSVDPQPSLGAVSVFDNRPLAQHFLQAFALAFYQYLDSSDLNLMPILVSTEEPAVSPRKAVPFRECIVAMDDMSCAYERLKGHVVEWGLPLVVGLPTHVLESHATALRLLGQCDASGQLLTAKWLVSWLSSREGGASTSLVAAARVSALESFHQVPVSKRCQEQVVDLLEFIVASQTFGAHDLSHLPLLPLGNGAIVTFGSAEDPEVHIVDYCDRMLLMFSQDRFVDPCIEKCPMVWQLLGGLASAELDSKVYRLRPFSQSRRVALLQTVLPEQWVCGGGDVFLEEGSEARWLIWLQAFWAWLDFHRDDDMEELIAPLRRWTLLPSSRDDQSIRLFRLAAKDERLLDVGEGLKKVAGALIILECHGLKVLRFCDKTRWLRQYKVFNTFVLPDSQDGLMCALHTLFADRPGLLRDAWGQLDASEGEELAKIIRDASRQSCSCLDVQENVNSSHWHRQCRIVSALPLFGTLNTSPDSRVALMDNLDFRVRPRDNGRLYDEVVKCGLPFPMLVVAYRGGDSSAASQLLDFCQLPVMCWTDIVICVLKNIGSLSAPSAEDLMVSLLENWSSLAHYDESGMQRALDVLHATPCIRSLHGTLRRPEDLLDPSLFVRLYEGTRGPFPSTRLAIEPLFCRWLRFRSFLLPEEVRERAQWLHDETTTISEGVRHRKCEHERVCGDSTREPSSSYQSALYKLGGKLSTRLGHRCSTDADVQREGPQQTVGLRPRQQVERMRSISIALLEYLVSGDTPPLCDLVGDPVVDLALRDLRWLAAMNQAGALRSLNLPWMGESDVLYSPKEHAIHIGGSEPDDFIIGVARPVVGEEYLYSRRMCNFVHLSKIGVHCEVGHQAAVEVVNALETAFATKPPAWKQLEWLARALQEYLYPRFDSLPPKIWLFCRSNLQGFFVPHARVALASSEHPAFDLEPFLWNVPQPLVEKGQNFCKMLKQNFELNDCIEALAQIKSLIDEEPTPGAWPGIEEWWKQLKSRPAKISQSELLGIAVNIVRVAKDLIEDVVERELCASDCNLNPVSFQDEVHRQARRWNLFLPTACGKIVPAQHCLYNDMPWQPQQRSSDKNPSLSFVDLRLTNADAYALGVQGLAHAVSCGAMMPFYSSQWIEPSGQHESLNTRVANILKDYPADSIFKELIQNASDAGASKMYFIWDWREHPKERVLTPDLACWQGPCLWVYNDAEMTDQDFDSLCRLGVGGKRQGDHIGRHGVGFNVVYHLTDLPSILSRDTLLILDPLVQSTQALGGSEVKPGLRICFSAPELESFEHQKSPYLDVINRVEGLQSDNSSVKGTLFRLPFRDEASVGRLTTMSPLVVVANKVNTSCSDRPLQKVTSKGLMEQFLGGGLTWLLFLRGLREIYFYTIDPKGRTNQDAFAKTERSSIPCGELAPRMYLNSGACGHEALVAADGAKKEALCEAYGLDPKANGEPCESEGSLAAAIGTAAAGRMPEQGFAATRIRSAIARGGAAIWADVPQVDFVLPADTVKACDGLVVDYERVRFTSANVTEQPKDWIVIFGREEIANELAKQCGIADEDLPMFSAKGAAAFPLWVGKSPILQLFCFFPLPVSLPFRVLLHGNFALRTHRGDLCRRDFDADSSPGGLWNAKLFSQIVLPLYRRMLHCLVHLEEHQVATISVISGKAFDKFPMKGTYWIKEWDNMFPGLDPTSDNLSLLLDLPTFYDKIRFDCLFPGGKGGDLLAWDQLVQPVVRGGCGVPGGKGGDLLASDQLMQPFVRGGSADNEHIALPANVVSEVNDFFSRRGFYVSRLPVGGKVMSGFKNAGGEVDDRADRKTINARFIIQTLHLNTALQASIKFNEALCLLRVVFRDASCVTRLPGIRIFPAASGDVLPWPGLSIGQGQPVLAEQSLYTLVSSSMPERLISEACGEDLDRWFRHFSKELDIRILQRVEDVKSFLPEILRELSGTWHNRLTLASFQIYLSQICGRDAGPGVARFLFDEIDGDGNGVVTDEELLSWLKLREDGGVAPGTDYIAQTRAKLSASIEKCSKIIICIVCGCNEPLFRTCWLGCASANGVEHRICDECLLGRFKEDGYVQCAHVDCQVAAQKARTVVEPAAPLLFRRLLSSELRLQYQQHSLRHWLEGHRGQVIGCTTANCRGWGLLPKAIPEGAEQDLWAQNSWQCQHCQVFFCLVCKQRLHRGQSCEQARRQRDDSVNYAFGCECSTQLVQEGGCKFVTCASCRAHWCWVCRVRCPGNNSHPPDPPCFMLGIFSEHTNIDTNEGIVEELVKEYQQTLRDRIDIQRVIAGYLRSRDLSVHPLRQHFDIIGTRDLYGRDPLSLYLPDDDKGEVQGIAILWCQPGPALDIEALARAIRMRARRPRAALPFERPAFAGSSGRAQGPHTAPAVARAANVHDAVVLRKFWEALEAEKFESLAALESYDLLPTTDGMVRALDRDQCVFLAEKKDDEVARVLGRLGLRFLVADLVGEQAVEELRSRDFLIQLSGGSALRALASPSLADSAAERCGQLGVQDRHIFAEYLLTFIGLDRWGEGDLDDVTWQVPLRWFSKLHLFSSTGLGRRGLDDITFVFGDVGQDGDGVPDILRDFLDLDDFKDHVFVFKQTLEEPWRRLLPRLLEVKALRERTTILNKIQFAIQFYLEPLSRQVKLVADVSLEQRRIIVECLEAPDLVGPGGFPPCVPSRGQELRRPVDLVDPSEEVLRKIFLQAEPDRLPCDGLSQRALGALRTLGMACVASVECWLHAARALLRLSMGADEYHVLATRVFHSAVNTLGVGDEENQAQGPKAQELANIPFLPPHQLGHRSGPIDLMSIANLVHPVDWYVCWAVLPGSPFSLARQLHRQVGYEDMRRHLHHIDSFRGTMPSGVGSLVNRNDQDFFRESTKRVLELIRKTWQSRRDNQDERRLLSKLAFIFVSDRCVQPLEIGLSLDRDMVAVSGSSQRSFYAVPDYLQNYIDVIKDLGGRDEAFMTSVLDVPPVTPWDCVWMFNNRESRPDVTIRLRPGRGIDDLQCHTFVLMVRSCQLREDLAVAVRHGQDEEHTMLELSEFESYDALAVLWIIFHLYVGHPFLQSYREAFNHNRKGVVLSESECDELVEEAAIACDALKIILRHFPDDAHLMKSARFHYLRLDTCESGALEFLRDPELCEGLPDVAEDVLWRYALQLQSDRVPPRHRRLLGEFEALQRSGGWLCPIRGCRAQNERDASQCADCQQERPSASFS